MRASVGSSLGFCGLLLLGATLAACSRLPAVAIPGSGGKVTREMIGDRVWLDEDPEAPRGSLLVFLSDGSLLMTSCGETWRLAAWRWVEGSRIVWEEDGVIVRADVALVGGDVLALSLELDGGETRSRSFRLARAPMVCPGG